MRLPQKGTKDAKKTLLSGMEIALSVETKLKPAKTAWQNADGAEKPDLRESESGFYLPHPQNPRSTGGKPYAQLD